MARTCFTLVSAVACMIGATVCQANGTNNVIVAPGETRIITFGEEVNNVLVLPTGSLALEGGAVIQGSVLVLKDASVDISFGEIQGNLVALCAENVGGLFAIVGGDVVIQGATGIVLLAAWDVGGDVVLSFNEQLGPLPPALEDSTVGGDVIVLGNVSLDPISIQRNTIAGALICLFNTPEPTSVDNTVAGGEYCLD